tara:strand:+ start:9135 stop:9326 length:192 start_codon:yes stop_codon:yes gene_type:complete
MSTAEQHLDSNEQASFTNGNRVMQALLIAAIAASSLSMIFSVGTAMASADQSTEPAAGVALNE